MNMAGDWGIGKNQDSLAGKWKKDELHRVPRAAATEVLHQQ